MAEKGKSKTAKLMDEAKALQKTFEKIAEAVETNVDKQLEKYGNLIDADERRAYQMQQRLEEEQKVVGMMDDIVKSLEKQTDVTEEQKESARNLLEAYDQQRQITEEVVKNLDGVTQGLESAATMGENLAGELFGINGRTEELGKALSRNNKYLSNSFRWWGKIGKSSLKQLDTANLVANANMKAFEALKQGAQNVKKYIEDLSPLGQAMDEARNFRTEIRLLSRDINIVTEEAMMDQAARIEDIATSTRSSSRDIMKVQAEMYKTSAAFRNEQPAVQDAIVTTGKMFEKRLNVPISNTAQMYENLRRLQGRTADESQKVTASFIATAQKLKMDVNPLTANYAAMSERLAKYSIPNVSKEILRMQHIQDQTGISMDKMMNSFDSLNTFEGAITAATRINILTGATVDAMELMRLADTNAVDLMIFLRENMNITAETYRESGRSMKESLAAATNMDVPQLQKLLETPAARLRELSEEAESATVSASDALKMLENDHAAMATDQEEHNSMIELQRKNVQSAIDLQEELKRDYQEFLRENTWAQWASMATGAIVQVAGALANLIIQQRTLNALQAGGMLGGGGKVAANAGKGGMLARLGGMIGLGGATAGGGAAAGGVGLGASILAPIAALVGGGYVGYKYADEISDFLGFGDEESGVRGGDPSQTGPAFGGAPTDENRGIAMWGSGLHMAQKTGHLIGQMQGGHGSVQGGAYTMHPNETAYAPVPETGYTTATTFLPPGTNVQTGTGTQKRPLVQNINLYLDDKVVASTQMVKDLSDELHEMNEAISLSMKVY